MAPEFIGIVLCVVFFLNFCYHGEDWGCSGGPAGGRCYGKWGIFCFWLVSRGMNFVFNLDLFSASASRKTLLFRSRSRAEVQRLIRKILIPPLQV